MLICPHCRGENLEEARFCHLCGRSLDPVATPLRRVEEREDKEDAFEIRPPKPPSAIPGIIAMVIIALGAAGFGLWYALRPNPCQDKYSSVLFSYCAEIPEGWEGGSQLSGEGNLDQFSPPEEDAATFVRVADVIDPATGTEQYAQQFRNNQVSDGLDPGKAESVVIDGEEAIAWNVSVPTEEGNTLRLREVVLVREDGAWRITLAATDDNYATARVAFEDMLESWHWK